MRGKKRNDMKPISEFLEDLLTLLPLRLKRLGIPAWKAPFSPTVIETLVRVPPFPHLGQNSFPGSIVTVKQATHLRAHLEIKGKKN